MLKKAAASQRLTGYNKILGAVLLTVAAIGLIVSLALGVYLVTALANVSDGVPTQTSDGPVGQCLIPFSGPDQQGVWADDYTESACNASSGIWRAQ